MSEASPPLTLKQTETADAALKIIGERGIAALTTPALAQEQGAAVVVVTHDHRTLDVFDTIFAMEDGLIKSA